jgi:cysteamine dioxygenase
LQIAVFFLPFGTVMPLHDHPGMTVFSKLLIGSAHVEGYDWVRPRVSGGGSRMLAEKVLDRDVTPASGTWALFPEAGGNMHRFVAGEETHCAFLDVLAPPYAPAEQRRCTYYKDTPYEPCRCKHCCSLARLTNRIGARCDHSHVSCLQFGRPQVL